MHFCDFSFIVYFFFPLGVRVTKLHDPVTRDTIITALPGARVIDPARATSLGSPIGDTGCISDVLKDKINALQVMGDRL